MKLGRGYPRLTTFLKNELPAIARNKKIMNAYIWTVVSRGGRRIPTDANDPLWARAKHLAPLALTWEAPPMAAVGVDKHVTSAVFDPNNNTVTFNEELVEGLEAADHSAGSMVYEMVAMHELTHWLDFNVHGTNFPSDGGAELGFVFEYMAYTKVELAMRNSLINRVRAYMKIAADGLSRIHHRSRSRTRERPIAGVTQRSAMGHLTTDARAFAWRDQGREHRQRSPRGRGLRRNCGCRVRCGQG